MTTWTTRPLRHDPDSGVWTVDPPRPAKPRCLHGDDYTVEHDVDGWPVLVHPCGCTEGYEDERDGGDVYIRAYPTSHPLKPKRNI